jgi:hypothetical protein
VAAQITGTPEFDVAVAPGAPHGTPTAGRVSTLVGVVGDAEWDFVVCGAADEWTGAVVVVAEDAVDVGVLVALRAGALTTGGGTAVAAGAGRIVGMVVTGDGVSTLLGVSSG